MDKRGSFVKEELIHFSRHFKNWNAFVGAVESVSELWFYQTAFKDF